MPVPTCREEQSERAGIYSQGGNSSDSTHPLHEAEPHRCGAQQREAGEECVALPEAGHVDAEHGTASKHNETEARKHEAYSGGVHSLFLCVSGRVESVGGQCVRRHGSVTQSRGGVARAQRPRHIAHDLVRATPRGR